ncbi:MAG: hypothetical protein ACFCU2_12145 [Acidimicrobiia bacterium]
MTDRSDRELALERAREDAEGFEVHDSPVPDRALEREREEAEGVEVFENPDATIPPAVVTEGGPGEEFLSGHALDEDDEEDAR